MEDFPVSLLDDYHIHHHLGHIPHPPKQLFIRGIFPTDPHLVFLTVVGSRNHSPYGREACAHLIKGLRGYPIVIVSGLALGIDRIAHESAIDAGLITLAFPGSGLDEKIIYPRANIKLAEKILHSGGCLISEYQNAQESQGWMFPMRNRLMAGISRATLIIEATHKSGSRITAKLATEYNRDVLAVPGEIFNTLAEGPNELIRLGATPVTSPANLLEALGFQITETPPMDLFSQCSPDEEKILKILSSPTPRGDIIRKLNMPTHQVNILLSQMELRGLIKDTGSELRRC